MHYIDIIVKLFVKSVIIGITPYLPLVVMMVQLLYVMEWSTGTLSQCVCLCVIM